MTNIDLATVPPFYQKYVALVKHMDVLTALEFSRHQLNVVLAQLSNDKADYAYAEGKWTIKELLCHIIDAERIFTYRALCFSRNDKTNLPGFDENAYVPESNAVHRTVDSIKLEFNNLRTSTIDFFTSCTPEMYARQGTANNSEISVVALAYIVSGHQMHHLNILKERYLV